MSDDGDQSDERGRELISAAKRLFDIDRLADERELMLVSVTESLGTGPKSDIALVAAVDAMWPGANITKDVVIQGARDGMAAGLVGQMDTLDGQDWCLTADGTAEKEMSREWYDEAVDRLAGQIQARADEDLGSINYAQAQSWARWMVAALAAGISGRADNYQGAVGLSAAGQLRPIQFDVPAILGQTAQYAAMPSTREFLQACLLAAIDESDLFANEMVGYVVTGCVLHAVAARQLGAGARKELGTLAGQRVIVDTNVLLTLLGSKRNADLLRRVITDAISQGIEVIVPDHVLDELEEVVDRVGSQAVPGLLDSLKKGIASRIYIQSVNENILAEFLRAVEENTYANWPQYVARAQNLPDELVELGVTVRSHNNQDRDRVDRARNALAAEITTGGGTRKSIAIDRDAETIEMAWRARDRHQARAGSLWPSAWILTTDSHVNATYRSLDRADEVPIAMRPAQFAVLLTVASPGSEASALVEAAASYVRQEAMVTMAIKYPPSTAIRLAEELGESGFSSTDERVAQMTLTGLIDGVDGSAPTGDQVLAQVLARRVRRTSEAQSQQREVLKSRSNDMDEVLVKSGERLKAEREARAELEQKSGDAVKENVALRRQLADERVFGRRKMVAVAVAVLGLVAVVVSFLAGGIGTPIAFFMSVVFFLLQAREWVSKVEFRWTWFLLALIPQVFAVIDIARLFSS